MAKYSPSQLHYTTTDSIPNQGSMSPPTISPGVIEPCNGKRKQRPTITPRTFTRFFTPRTSLAKTNKISTSRQVLREITASASNRKRTRQLCQGATDQNCELLDDGLEDFQDIKENRKKRRTISPSLTSDRSSPLKTIRPHSHDNSEDAEESLSRQRSIDELLDASDEEVRTRFVRGSALLRPIRSTRHHTFAAQSLHRELGVNSTCRRAHTLNYCKDWQSETTQFFSGPEDNYAFTHANTREIPLPFSTASCNTNSLIAIGDEEGGIRLLESEHSSSPGFSQAYLTFRPSANAIMDLAFSSDDMLLATASGDQTAQIIDMPTQRAVVTMNCHVSTVKQVRFQPGSSNNVIATSSRDGSVQIWDLRCRSSKRPTRDLRVSLDPHMGRNSGEKIMSWPRPVNSIFEAHAIRPALPSTSLASGKLEASRDNPSKRESPNRRGDISVTSLSFLPHGREHLFVTASEANATVKLWDMRSTHNHRRGQASPVSTTLQPESHTKHRQFGVTSLVLSGDGGRLYTLCRDNTVYAYATSHLVLGHAPELSLNPPRPRRSGQQGKTGLGPLYGFRHPKLHVTTFYVKLALRRANDDKNELLAVGSSDACAVIFPTDERYLQQIPNQSSDFYQSVSSTPSAQSIRNRHPSTGNASDTVISTRLNDTIPIFQQGSALIRGHSKEVTSLTWTSKGELVTVGDDFTARCWREGPRARDLRLGGETEGRRWGCGWAEAYDDWDDEE